MTWYLHKVQNEWVVTTNSFFTTSDLGKLYVFQNMTQVGAFLIKAAGEQQKRDAKGHFVPRK